MRSSNVRRDKPATTNQLSAYFSHHIQSLVFSLTKIYEAPATTIMTVAVIGITLSLPGGFYLFTGVLFVALALFLRVISNCGAGRGPTSAARNPR